MARTEAGCARPARLRLAAWLAPAALASLAPCGPALGQPIASQPFETTPPNQQSTPPSQAAQEPTDAAREPDTVLLFGLRTGVTLSDNLNLAPNGGDRQSGAALEASPYVIWTSNTARRRVDVRYMLRNVYRTTGDDFTLGRHTLDGRGTFALVSDWLWLDAYGRIANINASPFGPLSYDPVVAGTNVGDYRSFGISPYVRGEVPRLADYEVRYRYQWTNFTAPLAVRSLQAVSASLSSGGRLGRWQATWFGDVQRLERPDAPSIDRRMTLASLSYLLTPEVRVGALANWESVDFLTNQRGDTSGYGYGAFIDWRPNSRIATNVTWQRRYYGDTSSASASWRARRLLLSANYQRAVLSSADASLLFFDPSTVLTGGNPGVGQTGLYNPFFQLLNNPFTSALLQQQLLLYGLTPFDLAFASSALVLDRRATMVASLTGSQNTLTAYAFYNERESALRQTGATAGTGGGLGLSALLNGTLRQRGLDLYYSHRYDARTTFIANARRTYVTVEGFLGSQVGLGPSTLDLLSAGVSLRLTPDTIASVLLRRTNNRRENAATITENAIVGVLDMRF